MVLWSRLGEVTCPECIPLDSHVIIRLGELTSGKRLRRKPKTTLRGSVEEKPDTMGVACIFLYGIYRFNNDYLVVPISCRSNTKQVLRDEVFIAMHLQYIRPPLWSVRSPACLRLNTNHTYDDTGLVQLIHLQLMLHSVSCCKRCDKMLFALCPNTSWQPYIPFFTF